MVAQDSKSKEGFVRFDKAELAEFKQFWEGDVGKKYLKKIKDTKEQLLDAAMGSMDNDYILRSTAIANGFQSVIIDIESMIKAFDMGKKTEEEKKK